MKNRDLKGKTIVITGASSGVGKATALAFAKLGVNLVLAARRETLLQELASECESLGSEALAVKTDVTDKDSVKNLFNKAIEFYQNIDIWFNCAGVGAIGDFDETPLEAHEQVIRTNLLGPLYGSYYAMRHFKERGQGQIIYMNSTGSSVGTPFSEAYAIGKFGLKGLSESLRFELKNCPEIFISDIFASFIDTSGIHHLANYKGKEIKLPPGPLDPFDVAKKIVEVAKNPKNTTHIGKSDWLARFGHAVSPGLTGYIMSKAGHLYFRKAKQAELTDGNLFEPVARGAGVKS